MVKTNVGEIKDSPDRVCTLSLDCEKHLVDLLIFKSRQLDLHVQLEM